MRLAVLVLAGVTVAIAGVVVGCSQKRPESVRRLSDPVAPTVTRTSPTSALWEMAPPDATLGLVIGDGVPQRLFTVLQGVARVVAARPPGTRLLGELRGITPDGRDPLDEAAWKDMGLDLSYGMAIFGDLAEDRPTLVVLPVGDRVAFRKAFNATVDKEQGREVDVLGSFRCKAVARRYACAATLADLDAAAAPHESPAATTIKSTPPEKRGDMELYFDLESEQETANALRALEPVGRLKSLVASVTLQRDGVTGRAWAKGEMNGPLAPKFTSKPPTSLFKGYTGGATGILRLQLPWELLLAQLPPIPAAGNLDLRAELLEQLTGDIELVTAGKGEIGLAVLLGVKDGEKVKGSVAKLCALAELAMGETPGLRDVKSSGDRCTMKLSLPTDEVPFSLGLPDVTARIEARGQVLALSMGEATLDTLKGEAADDAWSVEAKDVLTVAHTVASWGRDLDAQFRWVKSVIPGESLGADGEHVLGTIEVVAWALAHVYEAAFGVSVRPDGIHALLRLSTFGAEPAEALQIYEAALAKRYEGDEASFQAAMAEIARKFPRSMLARQAQLTSTGGPLLGGATGIMAAIAIPSFLKYLYRSKSTEARVQVETLFELARAYYEKNKKLPATTKLTPEAGACCKTEDRKCHPGPDTWSHPTWKTLGFAPADPHYYSFQFIRGGDGPGGRFIVRAVGDLDCDGIFSTFQKEGRIGDNRMVFVYRDWVDAMQELE